MSPLFHACVFRAAAFSLLWWILSSGNLESWFVGLPTIAISVLASIKLLPPCTWSAVGTVRFILFFIVHSLRGGADVAWRAFHPGLPIDPVLVDYPLRLEPGRPRVYLLSVINLLPGTLSVSLNETTLKVHILNSGNNVIAELMFVEDFVALIFGVHLPTPGENNSEKI